MKVAKEGHRNTNMIIVAVGLLPVEKSDRDQMSLLHLFTLKRFNLLGFPVIFVRNRLGNVPYAVNRK